ncbi:hypothetical protein HDU88_007851 [Geranomyces variabilis]|nr:hypothetical protein HDU88_007851 [Geranomyces variabilis]
MFLALVTSKNNQVPQDDSSHADVVLAPWTPCYTERHESLQCSTLLVPLDHFNATSRNISIALVRRLGTSRNARLPPLFINPGGPGGSGIDFVINAGESIDDMVHGVYDLVSFDPRGVGKSNGVKCFATAAQQALFNAQTNMLDFPSGLNDTISIMTRLKRYELLAMNCGLHSNDILHHISTANVAMDMDRLREAMGWNVTHYLGYSYGTLIGVTYANLFPERVGRMILDGVADPEALVGGDVFGHKTVPYPFLSVEASINAFGDLCEAAGASGCALAGIATYTNLSVSSTLRRFVDDLHATPIIVPPTKTHCGGILTRQAMAKFLLVSLYSPRRWASVASAFAAAIIHKNVSALWLEVDVGDDDYSIYNTAITCADLYPTTVADLAQNAEVLKSQYPLLEGSWAWRNLACINWGFKQNHVYRGPWGAQTKTKILLIGTTNDPVAPLRMAQRLHSLMPQSSGVLIHDGYGHSSHALRSECTNRNIRAYLQHGDVDMLDRECKADEIIFPSVGTQ